MSQYLSFCLNLTSFVSLRLPCSCLRHSKYSRRLHELQEGDLFVYLDHSIMFVERFDEGSFTEAFNSVRQGRHTSSSCFTLLALSFCGTDHVSSHITCILQTHALGHELQTLS